YRNGRGVFDISFSFEKGEIYALLGPNGAGKTTIMKAMTGLIKKNSGDVIIDGISTNDNLELVMGQVGCMIGKVVAYEYLTAFQNLRLKANYYDLADEAIDEILALVGLQDNRDEKVKIFSTGMKQRLGIAHALIGDPSILILDEPFNGMDIEGKRQVRDLIQTLASKYGKSILISSHMINEIEAIYTQLGILHEGRIIEVGSKSEVSKQEINLEDYYINAVAKRRQVG
ncbi:MAG: ATP-binding cassette domain-containing protein, partial [Vallitaleaceae bacterium]|nr:ATP-binding cassette domain-containing protein [Vallitaleaceae bacterium]